MEVRLKTKKGQVFFQVVELQLLFLVTKASWARKALW